MRRFLLGSAFASMLAGVTLSVLSCCVGCTVPGPGPLPVPPPIPTPIPTPVPNPVPDPTPTPVGDVVTPDRIAAITPGMTVDALLEAVGRKPDGDRAMDDGTRILRWAAVNSAGDPKWLDVQVENGVVLGRRNRCGLSTETFPGAGTWRH